MRIERTTKHGELKKKLMIEYGTYMRVCYVVCLLFANKSDYVCELYMEYN